MIFINENCGRNIPPTISNNTSLQLIPSPAFNMQPTIAFQLAPAKKEYLTDRLKKHFPTRLAALFSIFMSALGLAAIGLQVLMICDKTPNWKLCQGFWGGIVCIGLAITNLVLSKFFAYQINILSLITFI